MNKNEILNKYPKLIKVMKEAGIWSRDYILNIEVDHKLVKHNLHFIGDKYYESNVIEFVVHVKENKLKIKTTDYFKTYEYAWNEEL